MFEGYETTYCCPKCGGKTQPTVPWRATSEICAHNNPTSGMRCGASGKLATHAKRREVDLAKCPACELVTMRHKSSGWTQPHWNYFEGRSCEAGIGGIRAFPEDPIKLRLVGEKPKPGSDYTEKEDGTWTVSGGLPTMGKGR